MEDFGAQSMVRTLRRVLMRRPGASLKSADPVRWHYGPAFDAAAAIDQYEAFADLVAASGADILWMDDADDGLADAMFTHDPSLVSDAGAILLNMGKALRRPEVDAHERAYRRAGIPILGRVVPSGTVEGGDCVWLDDKMLVVGRGVRSNDAGIVQLRAMLSAHGIAVLGFDLPLWQGEASCLHLMSVISPLDDDLALVFAPLLPAPFYQLLKSRGITLVEAPAEEFHASNGLSLNVLALAPRSAVMIDGFDATRRALEAAGCRVSIFAGDALCIACEGGPTCLTRPILRQAL